MKTLTVEIERQRDDVTARRRDGGLERFCEKLNVSLPLCHSIALSLRRLALIALRSIAFSMVTAVFYVLWLVGLLLVLHPYQWRCWAFRNWAKTLLVVLGIKLDVQGAVPPAPCLLVANHLSYLDIVILAAQYDCVFVAKSEVARWPIFGVLCQSMATIFIDRRRRRDILRVNQLLENALQAGKSVMFFPEGTTTHGASILPFKSGLFEPAAKKQIPVLCASLHYRTAARQASAAQSVCWWGEMEFIPHLLQLFGLTKIEARLRFNATLLCSDNRKQLAREAHTAVQEIFIPVTNNS